MVKSTRSGHPASLSALSLPLHPSSRSSLHVLPTELLYMTFQGLDIPNLLRVCNTCKRFRDICTEILSKKFNEPEVGLMLSFEQEYKFIFKVPFKFSKFDRRSGNFVFKPTSTEPMRFVHSSMVRSPFLSRVYINLPNHNTSTITTSTTTPESSHPCPPSPPSPPNSSIKSNENFLEKSLNLNIKSNRSIIREVRYVYRMGHGTTHLKIPYIFTYSTTDIPPPSTQSTRGGERWVTPISFECAPGFFYPREPIAYKIIMTIIRLRKRNLNKKKSSPSSPSQILKRKQKQTDNIGFEEVEGFISIAVINDTNHGSNREPNHGPILDKREQEHLRSLKTKGKLTRWNSGARC